MTSLAASVRLLPQRQAGGANGVDMIKEVGRTTSSGPTRWRNSLAARAIAAQPGIMT